MPRRQVAARLSEDAADAFDRLCTARGVTFTALLQALGEAIDDGPHVIPERVIRRARAVDRERGSRRRSDGP